MNAPTFHPFDVYSAPLDAPTLIEASAGTGKTWAIGGLYARLVVERGLAVENILVVTYTKAATAELSGRIRAKLADLLGELKGRASGDAFCAAYAASCADNRDLALRRVTQALRCLDDAAVFTIHGFCQRVLNEWAFEAGVEFDAELLVDERELVGEVIDDYWRREVQPAHGAWVDYLVECGETPDGWLEEMLPHLGKRRFLKVAALPAGGYTAGAEAALDAAFRAAREIWQEQGEVIRELLLGSPALNRNSYRKPSLEKWFAELEGWFAGEAAGWSVPEKLVKLTPAELEKGCKAGQAPPDHVFFPACQCLLDALGELAGAYRARLVALKADLLAWCEEELPLRKRERGLLSYHDLLNRFADALDGPHGARLAALVRGRYPAALIDEFQDTDPVQYAIFQRLYGGLAAPVFYVGDPKQAIYGFRGADVYTYLEAYRVVEQHVTQNVNQRSSPALIGAVNALFDVPQPFLVGDIGFRPVQPSERDLGQLKIPGDQGAAMHFRLFPEREGGGVWAKEDANRLAARGCAAEIATLLGSGAVIEKVGVARPLNGGDIAVLVPAHRQGRLVQEELTRRGVAAVRYGQDNVFESNEAGEMETLLRAVLEPGRAELTRAALAGEALGGEGGALFALRHDAAASERRYAAFRRYHELWRDHGFMRFFRAWLDDNGVALRLLAFRDGERRLTNWLHLAELLQVESHARHGMEALLGWLARTRRAPRADQEGALLRLESDAQRVRIVTIHASKGLEYPVVFCPFLWDGRLWRRDEEAITFHDPHDGQRPTLDLGSPEWEEHRRQASLERLAERLRLLYVALTRAQYRCHVAWGAVKEMESSALAWLLHGPREAVADPLEALAQRCAGMSSARLVTELQEFAARANGAVDIGLMAVDEGGEFAPAGEAPQLALRVLGRSLAAGWRMTSFSALSQGRHSEAPDYDALPARPAEGAVQRDIFAFPRGAQAGTCLHAIFEGWEFTCRDEAKLAAHVAATLRAYFIEEHWTPAVAGMVRATLDVPLDGATLRLAEIGAGQCLVEMGFTYPLAALDPARLAAVLADPAHGVAAEFATAAQELDFPRINGYLMGFIDLVFEAGGRYYLADYKSNWLGASRADYQTPALVKEMAEAHYYLQYLIYCVALHRHLRISLADYDYQRHFGGVYYLFLRGIGADGGTTGIFHDRPSAALIEALDGLIGGGDCHVAA